MSPYRFQSTAAAVVAGLSTLVFSLSTFAQVEWDTTLNDAPAPIALSQHQISTAPDGAIYTIANTGSSTNRMRVTRTTAAGTIEWTRWLEGTRALSADTGLLIHPDSSLSVPLFSNNALCIANLLTSGTIHRRFCIDGQLSNPSISVATDGDLFIALGDQRKVRKVGPDGTQRWVRTESNFLGGNIGLSGLDSSGNYFELQAGLVRVWRTTDGVRITNTLLPTYPHSAYPGFTAQFGVARAGGDIAILGASNLTSNALTTTVLRYGSGGVLQWTRSLILPGAFGSGSKLRIYPAPNDGVFVVRKPDLLGYSDVVLISSTGEVLWQRDYAGIRDVIMGASGLLAIRSDVSATDSNSYIFSIATVDGALGTPTIYTRPDTFAPTAWFAAGTGVIATFQGYNFFSPFASFPVSLAASNVFLGNTPANRWVTVATAAPDMNMSRSGCLMPRLKPSSPNAYRAQTEPTEQLAKTQWRSVSPSSGVAGANAPESNRHCGFSVASDSGDMAISTYTNRVTRRDATGTTVWQASSTVNPAEYSNFDSIQLVSPSNETSYAVGSLVGRVSATGAILFETETSKGAIQHLNVDGANNIWVVSGREGVEGFVSKISPTGVLLWSTAINAPACADSITAAKLTASDEMIVATQSCGEGRVFKIASNGFTAWQRVVSGNTQRPFVRLKALHEDSAGNLYAGGCVLSDQSVSLAPKALSQLASWTASGTERWSNTANIIGIGQECISSIATDSSNRVFAVATPLNSVSHAVIWALDNSGAERWRHANLLPQPNVSDVEALIDSDGKMIALAETAPNLSGGRTVSMRKINLDSITTNTRLKFLSVPNVSIGYREQFSVRVGLRTLADVAENATVATEVRLSLNAGTGSIAGSLNCAIPIGASDCVISDTRYDAIDTAVTLVASADAMPSVVSPALNFVRATTTTLISAKTSPPYTAYSVIRVRADLLGPPPGGNSSISYGLSGPRSGGFSSINACVNADANGNLGAAECDFLIRSSHFPLTASFTDNDPLYAGSTATPLTLAFSKVTPVLDVVAVAENTYITGDIVRFRVALRVGTTFNAAAFIGPSAISVSGGSCTNAVRSGFFGNGFATSYFDCSVNAPTVGALAVTFNFAGDDDLLPAAAVTQNLTINNGAVVRSNEYIPTGVTACSLDPAITCTTPASGGWQCVGPSGMSGAVFLVPNNSNGYYFPDSPYSFSNVVGNQTYNTNQPWDFAGSSCRADVDGDGARLPMTDGILILRRILTISGAALTNGVTHACVPRTAVGIASGIDLSSYDIDGDGQTRAETDGMLMLRAMLGFDGEALIAGAVGANATRRTAFDVLNWLRFNCSFPTAATF